MTSANQLTMRSTAPAPKKDPKTGTWRFVFDSIHPNPDGSRRQVRRRGFATRAAAKAELDRLKRQDTELIAPLDGTLTVGMLMDQLVRAKRLARKAPKTIAHYVWASAHVKERWGGWAADKLTHEHLETAYVEMLASGRRQWYRGKGTFITDAPLSPRSVEAVHKALKAAYALAIRRRQLTTNPADEIELNGSDDTAKSSKPRPHWTPEQVGKFLEYVTQVDNRPTGLADVLADTGARIGEVLGLHWEEVDLDKGVVTILWQLVPDPEASSTLSLRKTKRPRSKSVIALHSETITALRARKAEQSAQRLVMGTGWPATGVNATLVFTWPDGRGMNSKTVSKRLARLSVAAGLPRLTAHGFRHSFATAALTARVPVEVVAARLGNTPRVVQETYQHVIPAEDEAAAQLVGDLYRAGRKA